MGVLTRYIVLSNAYRKACKAEPAFTARNF
jgi:hypothetical protein